MRAPALPIIPGGLLDEVSKSWTDRGWSLDTLGSFRMEMTPEQLAAKQAADEAAAKEAADKAAADALAKKEPVTFTPDQQAHIDGIIAKATGKAKTQSEADFKKWLDQQALTETDRLKAEGADKDKAVEEAKREVLATRVETAAERAAVKAGVNPDRVDRFMKLVNLSDLDSLTSDGKPDADAIAAAVTAALTDVPEFKGAAGGAGGGAGGGDFTGGGGGKVWTKAEIAKLSVDEYDKHEPEILKQLQTVGIK